jgi:hypothetical protein
VIEATRAAENGSKRDSSEAALVAGTDLLMSQVLFLSWRNGAAVTTVDHADIRGLVTACLAFVVELPLAKGGSFADWRDPIVEPRILRPWPRPPFQET